MSPVFYIAIAIGLAAATNFAPAAAAPPLIEELEADCLAGDGFACKRWGTHLNMTFPGPSQPAKARAAFEKGCALKESVACAHLYQMLALGQGGPKDLQRAKQLERAACNHPQMGISSAIKASGLCAD